MTVDIINRRNILIITICLILLLMTGCERSSFVSPPYVPPKYLGAIEIKVWQITDAVQSSYDDLSSISEILSNKVVVIKDIELTREILSTKDMGFIRLEYIECQLADESYLDDFRKGHMVDIAGICQVSTTYHTSPFTLIDCIFLPAGAVDLTVGSEDITLPGY